jgi:hypothetical protein
MVPDELEDELLLEELFPLDEEPVLLDEEVVPLDDDEEVVSPEEVVLLEEVMPLEEVVLLDDAPPVLTSLAPPWPPSPVPPHEQTASVPRNPTPRRNAPRLRTRKAA